MKIEFKKSLKLRNKLFRREHELSNEWYTKTYKNLKGKSPEAIKRGVRTMYTKIAKQTSEQVEEDLELVVQSLVDEFEKKTGITVDSSFVPGIAAVVMAGKLYKSKWTFDKATKAIVDKYGNVVTVMVDNDKDADAILAVLNPNDSQYQHTVNTDDGTMYVPKIGAATSTLMRTTVEHGFQEAIVQLSEILEKETHKEVMIRWISALEWNTCEVCEGRHNELYRPEDLPLEHPNGQCEFCIEYT